MRKAVVSLLLLLFSTMVFAQGQTEKAQKKTSVTKKATQKKKLDDKISSIPQRDSVNDTTGRAINVTNPKSRDDINYLIAKSDSLISVLNQKIEKTGKKNDYFLYGIFGLITLLVSSIFYILYKNKEVEHLKGSIIDKDQWLINYKESIISKTEYENLISEKALLKSALENKDRELKESELKIKLLQGSQVNKVPPEVLTNNKKDGSVITLYAQIPNGDTFQRVKDMFTQYESFFEIITDMNKRSGKYRIVSDEETAIYAFQMIDQLKYACFLKGIGKPASLRQAQQEEGTVEFDGTNWKIVNKMTLTW